MFGQPRLSLLPLPSAAHKKTKPWLADTLHPPDYVGGYLMQDTEKMHFNENDLEDSVQITKLLTPAHRSASPGDRYRCGLADWRCRRRPRMENGCAAVGRVAFNRTIHVTRYTEGPCFVEGQLRSCRRGADHQHHHHTRHLTESSRHS